MHATSQSNYAYYGESNGEGTGDGCFRGVVSGGERGLHITGSGAYGAYCIGQQIAISGNGTVWGGFFNSVGPFTGCHEGLIKKSESFEVGDIVCIKGIANRGDVINVIPFVEVAKKSDAKSAYGVITQAIKLSVQDNGPLALREIEAGIYANYQAEYNNGIIAGVGEGQINVCSIGGDIEAGDFIATSTVRGKGKLYVGTDMRCVVAKAMESVEWTQEPEATKMIACVYMSG